MRDTHDGLTVSISPPQKKKRKQPEGEILVEKEAEIEDMEIDIIEPEKDEARELKKRSDFMDQK